MHWGNLINRYFCNIIAILIFLHRLPYTFPHLNIDPKVRWNLKSKFVFFVDFQLSMQWHCQDLDWAKNRPSKYHIINAVFLDKICIILWQGMRTQSGNFKHVYLILQPQETKTISKNVCNFGFESCFCKPYFTAFCLKKSQFCSKYRQF